MFLTHHQRILIVKRIKVKGKNWIMKQCMCHVPFHKKGWLSCETHGPVFSALSLYNKIALFVDFPLHMEHYVPIICFLMYVIVNVLKHYPPRLSTCLLEVFAYQ